MGRVEGDHIKWLITLTSDNIKRLSLYLSISGVPELVYDIHGYCVTLVENQCSNSF